MQGDYRELVHQFPSVLATVLRMIRFAEMLRIPVFTTLFWPSVYGACIPEVDSALSEWNSEGGFFAKIESFGNSRELTNKLKRDNFSHAMICGVEAHIGIEGQARALAMVGITVHVIADGISSCNQEEVPLSLVRLRKLDRTSISTSESIIFYVIDALGERMQGDERKQLFTEIFYLLTEERSAITTGLRNLLGKGGSASLEEGSEVLD
ncbi:hypothetical protein FRC19_006091 [Serendipita sp. 401]|nr:hypothetical protein FRC19_006091 [Serendipita sp. 401]